MKVALIVVAILVSSEVRAETCMASVYNTKESHWGSRTASGIRLRDEGLTMAHKTYKLRGWMRVTNRRTSQTVELQVIDRGPYHVGRCADITQAANKVLACAGLCPVTVEGVR